jgi:choline kinase
VKPAPSFVVSDALVLAAGNGGRFQTSTRQSKLLQPILGQPLILRTLEMARDAGVARAHLVVGYQADAIRAAIAAHPPSGLTIEFTYNPDWHLENGVSALAARARLMATRFAVLMGDHLFESRMLSRLLRTHLPAGESLLAVDSRPAPPAVVAEATKVRLAGTRIVAIGKDLIDFDALDTGVFVCTPDLFDALDRARASGDTTLSGGIRQLAARGMMRGVDIGGAAWYDIDTVADLEAAERLLDVLRSERAEEPCTEPVEEPA